MPLLLKAVSPLIVFCTRVATGRPYNVPAASFSALLDCLDLDREAVVRAVDNGRPRGCARRSHRSARRRARDVDFPLPGDVAAVAPL